MITSISETATQLLALLEPLPPDDRRRVVNGVLILLGQEAQATVKSEQARAMTSGDAETQSAKEFFDHKQANSKIEELAIAARFRELTSDAESHTKADLELVFKTARRNFDAIHFKRDLDNAKKKGFFTKGSDRGSSVLAYYGQNYVDALPNRDALKEVRAPKGSGRRAGKKSPGDKGKQH